jgi:hypothetical protein
MPQKRRNTGHADDENHRARRKQEAQKSQHKFHWQRSAVARPAPAPYRFTLRRVQFGSFSARPPQNPVVIALVALFFVQTEAATSLA